MDFVMADWFYDRFVNAENEEYKQVLPYPLWKKKPKWTMNTTIPGGCPFQKLTRKTFGACPSTKNWMNKTVVVPWPCDFQLGLDETGESVSWIMEDIGLLITHHSRDQLPDWDTRGHIKFGLPYCTKSKGLMLMTGPHLHQDITKLPYEVTMGLVETINTPLQCNANTMWREMGKDEAFFAFAGDPMFYLTFPNVKGKVRVRYLKSDADQGVKYGAKLRQKFVLR